MLAVTVCSALAQTPATEKASTPGELLQANAANNEPYRLGRGDLVMIRIENRPEMSGHQPIGPDGSITIPVVGSVIIADKTREEAAAAITEAMSPYYIGIAVTVGVEAYNSNKVLLLGAVEKPGMQTFDTTPTLLEVLSRGGGLQRTSTVSSGSSSGVGGQQSAMALNGGLPDRCTIYRGQDTVLFVDLKKLMTEGSSLADLRLKRDDVVFVPAQNDQSVSVLGQVNHPGIVPLAKDSTLARIIAQSGGLGEKAGKNPSIRILEQATGKSRDVEFADILKPGGPDVTLHPGDLIYVPTSGFNNAAYVIEKISPLVSIFTVASLLTH